jgi:hypothetical protein
MTPIAIRLFENAKYGSTYGAGLRRSAVYNATAEITEPYAKYLLDFEPGAAWVDHARTEDQLATARRLIDQVERDQEVLWSWVKWYDKTTGEKELVAGFAAYDMDNEEIALHLDDGKRALTEQWFLPARRCTGRVGKNSPVFLATNCDLA